VRSYRMSESILDINSKIATPLPRLAYTMQETATILGVSYITVHRLIRRGLLKSSNALRHKLIPLTEIERFLKASIA
jgi:excisionase family DNA binding protein